MQALLELDKKLFLWINGWGPGPADYFLGWTTFLGTPLLFILVLAFMFIWDRERVLRKFALVLALGLLGGVLLPALFKQLVERARPFNAFYDEIAEGRVVVRTMFQLYISGSFPSGHAALAFSAAAALNLVYRQRLKFLYLLAGILALTRIYVGAHFPSDVLAGAIAGILGARLAYSLVKRYAIF